MIFAEIENLESFQEAMRQGESILARGMWHGTSKSMARYRKKFLEKTPLNIRGRKSGNPRSRQTRNTIPLGRRFIWQVEPKTPPKAKRFSSDHVKSMKQVSGNFGTLSEAAYGLEKGGTITPKKGSYLGIPIAIPGNDNTMKRRVGEAKPRAKKSWRKLSKILKKRSYNVQFHRKGSQTIVFARKKDTDSKPFPVMLLIRKVTLDKGGLGFFRLFRKFVRQKKGVIDSFDEELKLAVENLARISRKKRR